MNISYHEERKRGRLRVQNKRPRGSSIVANQLENTQESFIALVNDEQKGTDEQNQEEKIQPERSSFWNDMISNAFADEKKADDQSSNSDPSDSEFEHNAESYENRIMREVAIAGENANKSPTNPDLWLKYLKAQENALMDPLKGTQNSSRTETILNELKLRTYKTALKHVDDDRVLCGYLNTISDIWESDKVIAKWKQFLEKYPEKISIWRGYVNFLQTDWKHFHFETVVKAYEECLLSLSRRLSKSEVDIHSMLKIFLNCKRKQANTTFIIRTKWYGANYGLYLLPSMPYVRPGRFVSIYTVMIFSESICCLRIEILRLPRTSIRKFTGSDRINFFSTCY